MRLGRRRPIARISVGRETAKRPRGSIVGLLLDNSTKKSQTLNRFGNTLNGAVGIDTPEHADMAGAGSYVIRSRVNPRWRPRT
jgi:hypothetical protein